MGVMFVLNETGHTEVAWDIQDPVTTLEADAEFAKLAKKGYSAFTRFGSVDQLVRIKEFQPDAEEILWIRPLRGG